MRILLIGNFAPPYEDENIHNFSLLKKLRKEGHECSVINISENPSRENGFIDANSYIDFVFKVIRYSWKSDVTHCLTKGYTRLGLLKLMTAILIGRLFRVKPVITLHSELFSIIGQMRSPVGGEQTVYLSFSFAHKIIFQDKDTFEAASKYRKKPNFELIPLFIEKGKALEDDGTLAFRRLRDKKRIVIFSGVCHPSFIFDILSKFLSDYVKTRDIGIVISFAETSYLNLQRAIEDTVGGMAENLVFADPDDLTLLSKVYTMVDLIVRPLSCDGKLFFQDFAVYIRKPSCSDNFVYFPKSMVFAKEGDMADICAFITNAILTEKDELIPGTENQDYYSRIKRIYSE
jgi:hypothetical protein